jgi:serine phosphatase RsbU (regulator of sigma subunit)
MKRDVSGLRNHPIPSYTRLDLGLLWHASGQLEVSLCGHNLSEERHAEAVSFSSSFRGEVPRSAQLRLTWRP